MKESEFSERIFQLKRQNASLLVELDRKYRLKSGETLNHSVEVELLLSFSFDNKTIIKSKTYLVRSGLLPLVIDASSTVAYSW